MHMRAQCLRALDVNTTHPGISDNAYTNVHQYLRACTRHILLTATHLQRSRDLSRSRGVESVGPVGATRSLTKTPTKTPRSPGLTTSHLSSAPHTGTLVCRPG